jgi:predicted transglutaminase-like cysteine proteinase
LGDGVVFHCKTLRELTLAAGLWLMASAAMAAPQPGQDMPLGPSALPPKGYVAFCERKPQDCGPDVATVVAGARRADADRAELMAQLGPAMPPVIMPAALGGSGPVRPIRASWTAPAAGPALLPAPELQLASVEAAQIQATVTFIDPFAEALRESESRAPRMTPKLWSLLNSVNGQVNGAIEQRTDMANYGREDFWNTPLEEGRRAGDCEDYVLEKQRALLEAGMPRRALNIALVTTRWGESHAVLLVATSEGEYVLDNLSPWLVTWRQAPYRWVRRQLDGDAFSWAMIEDQPRTNDSTTKGLLIASSR